MRNASIAEWILRRLTSSERAASIVGDLVEIGERKGTPWFWFSFAAVVFSSVWRRSLAFIAALYAGTWTFSEFITTADSIYSKHYLTGGWNLAFGPLIFTGSTLWAVFFYAAIRYGFLDRTMQLAFVWAGLFTTVICFWWQPEMLAVCIAAAFFVVLGSISNSGFRMEALAVLVSVVGGSAVRFLAIMLAGLYQYFLGLQLHILWGDREMREHPSIGWVNLCMVLLSILAATSIWSRNHNWVTWNRRLESEAEGQASEIS
jgi:hypothetical protein